MPPSRKTLTRGRWATISSLKFSSDHCRIALVGRFGVPDPPPREFSHAVP
jgi:hypothetical protein